MMYICIIFLKKKKKKLGFHVLMYFLVIKKKKERKAVILHFQPLLFTKHRIIFWSCIHITSVLICLMAFNVWVIFKGRFVLSIIVCV